MDTSTPSHFVPEKERLILVVEDNPALQELLATALRTVGGYTVLFVGDGSEALDALRTVSPDLLLLDYHLPDMTGLQLYDRLHAQKAFQHLPAILLSAALPHLELEKRHLIGVYKPFHMTELREALQQALQGKKKRPRMPC